MNTFLFAWNPKRWPWEDLQESIDRITQVGYTIEKWTVKSHKKTQIGDRVFLMRLGENPKGIIASGFVSSSPYLSKHYIEGKDPIYRVMINFEIILSYETLNSGNLSKINWTPHGSGYEIDPKLTDELEALWFNFLASKKEKTTILKETKKLEIEFYHEGTPSQVLTTIYERNPYARKICLDHYGLTCSVCNFNFEEVYGKLGKGFIHVHHLNPVSSIAQDYRIDPIQDLRPLCPNCHAMIHKPTNPLSIEELKEIILNTKLT